MGDGLGVAGEQHRPQPHRAQGGDRRSVRKAPVTIKEAGRGTVRLAEVSQSTLSSTKIVDAATGRPLQEKAAQGAQESAYRETVLDTAPPASGGRCGCAASTRRRSPGRGPRAWPGGESLHSVGRRSHRGKPK